MHLLALIARPPVAVLLALVVVGAGLGDARAAAAQEHPAAAAGVTPARLGSAARPRVERAQESFERHRRWLLPRAHGSGGGRCDVRIGRFCYWYDAGSPTGPPEPERIGEARRRLLALLDSATAADPADDLVAGLRVRYWLEANAPDTALAAGRACAATPWWCAALRGWALHEAGVAAGAGAAFDSALAAMPEVERCAWNDLSLLLDGDARARYLRLGCAERAEVERRFWWLTTPFFSRGGNDRRNEHLARRALARLARESATTYDARWGDDMEELLLRYGWAERWSRRDAAGLQQQGASVIGHEPVPAHQWTPSARLLDSPWDATQGDWTPDAHVARERFAAPVARVLAGLDAGAATFRRGDAMLVVTTFARPRDGRLDGAPASVVLAREESSPMITPSMPDSAGGVATSLVAPAPHLVSIEILADSGVAARARFAVSPPATEAGALALSGLLPYHPERDADPSFDDAVRLALRGTALSAPGRLGIYWEIYGLQDGRHPLETSLAVVPEREGWLGRAWRRVRGRAPVAPVSLRWTDLPVVRGGRAGRAVTIELPALEGGRYEIELQVRAADGRSATSARRLTVVR